jgi:hypothetical protein
VSVENRVIPDELAAKALVDVLGGCTWQAVAFAHGYLAVRGGVQAEEAARLVRSKGKETLKRSRDFVNRASTGGFQTQLKPRERTGSAQNPITKLFPSTITELRFREELDEMLSKKPSLKYSDERKIMHGLSDFTVSEASDRLPINVKNAGTRFLQALALVGLDPDDCIPIPAYKANGALSKEPNLLYAVAVDFDLIGILNSKLTEILSPEEHTVWVLLNRYSGFGVQAAEDQFVFGMVAKYWPEFKGMTTQRPFHVVSARKVIHIMNTMPKRTPGIGMKAWGTGARAEMNVHLSINEDMTPWDVVRDRIISKGVLDLIGAVNRKVVKEVYEPEI